MSASGPAIRPTTSKRREVAGIASLASAGLACVGYILANVIGDQTPPYEDSLANVVVWAVFQICSIASLLLALLFVAWLIRDETRR